jgi:hypothetical protein
MSGELDLPTGGPRWWPVSRVQHGLLLAAVVTWLIGILYATHVSANYQGVDHAIDGALVGLAWSILPVIALLWLAIHYSSPDSVEDELDHFDEGEHFEPVEEIEAEEPADAEAVETEAPPDAAEPEPPAAEHPTGAPEPVAVAEPEREAEFEEPEPEWVEEPWAAPRAARLGTLAATVLVWVLALIPTLLACGSMGTVSVLHPDRLPYPQSVGYLLLCLAAGLLLLVAVAQTVVAGASLLGALDDAEPTSFGSLTVTAATTAVAGVLVGVLVAWLAGPTGAVDASQTAGPLAPAVDGAPTVDLSKVHTLDVAGLRNLGATAAGIFATKGRLLVDVDPATGAVRWSLSRPGSAPDPLLWNHNNTFSATGVEADHGRVLLTAWDYWRGVRAYAADTGQLLWGTTDSSWEEYPGSFEDTHEFFRNDPRTGKRKWSAAYRRLGCVSPSTDGILLGGLHATMFQCPSATNPSATNPGANSSGAGNQGRSVVIGALNPANGQLLWKRQSSGALLNVTQGDIGVVELSLTDYQLLDAATGTVIGHFNDIGDPEFLAGGYSLTASKTSLRLTAPDGTLRWTKQLRPWEDLRDRVATANAIVTVIGHGPAAWVIAYDIKDGHRTVVAGPGPTPDGETPTLTLNVTTNTNIGLQALPWGVLIPTTDAAVGIIPAS